MTTEEKIDRRIFINMLIKHVDAIIELQMPIDDPAILVTDMKTGKKELNFANCQ